MSAEDKVVEIANKLRANVQRGSKNYYAPLSKEDSKIIRRHFINHTYLSLEGDSTTRFYNKQETLIFKGYTRIVVGDYGVFLEANDEQIVKENVKNRWPGEPSRLIKYTWMQTNDECSTKVYFQRLTVPYADYRPNFYYADLSDLHTDDKAVLYDG